MTIVAGAGPGTEEQARRLAGKIVERLRARGLTIAVAESSTGGLIGHLLTEAPGSSAVFTGGVIAYSNVLKRKLGVPADVLTGNGAVSAETAEVMAAACSEWSGANLALAETGVAGPGGGSSERPAGLFFIALAGGGSVRSERIQANGDRSQNKRACAVAALRLIESYLESAPA